jgi:enterochelin esterase family protein
MRLEALSRLGVGVAILSGTATFQPTPIVQSEAVQFIAAGTPSDPPRIVADFNGWEGGDMTPSGDGRTYTLRVTLDPAARIEYLIAYQNKFVLDPGNPLTVPSPAGLPRSELRMPEYRPPAPLPPPHSQGRIVEVPFTSKTGETRRIRAYLPATARRDVPILYVHDGAIFIDALSLPSILDSLISAGRMEPTVVACIDAVDRHDDYAPGSPFRSVFTSEIVPMLEHRYPIARDRRAVLGLSRSTVGALDACANGSVHFDACALLASAIPAKDFSGVLPVAGSTTRVFIETGLYDIPLLADARALRRELEGRALNVRYVESPEGHNHTAFRARLPELLEQIFPSAPMTAPPL